MLIEYIMKLCNRLIIYLYRPAELHLVGEALLWVLGKCCCSSGGSVDV